MKSEDLTIIARTILSSLGYDPDIYTGIHPKSAVDPFWEDWTALSVISIKNQTKGKTGNIELNQYVLYIASTAIYMPKEANSAWFTVHP